MINTPPDLRVLPRGMRLKRKGARKESAGYSDQYLFNTVDLV